MTTTQYRDKYYFRAAAYQRVAKSARSDEITKNWPFTELDLQQIETKAQELRDEHARRLRVRDGHEE